MDQDQAEELGQRLRQRREALELSIRQLAERTGVNHSTVVRLEQGLIDAPAPDKLSRIAEALGLNLADVFALADYVVPAELPAFTPYLRSKYRDLPAPAVEELERSFRRIAKRHGYVPDGPQPGEDEQPELTNRKKGGSNAKPRTTSRKRRS